MCLATSSDVQVAISLLLLLFRLSQFFLVEVFVAHGVPEELLTAPLLSAESQSSPQQLSPQGANNSSSHNLALSLQQHAQQHHQQYVRRLVLLKELCSNRSIGCCCFVSVAGNARSVSRSPSHLPFSTPRIAYFSHTSHIAS